MSNRSAAITLLAAAWLAPIIWLAGMWVVSRIGAGFILHLVSWPFAWTASLLLGAAGAVKWYERADLRRMPRALGTVFGAVSGLAAFPLGLYGVGAVLSRIHGGN